MTSGLPEEAEGEAGQSEASLVARRVRQLQGVTQALAQTMTRDDVLDVVIDHGVAAAEAAGGSLSVVDTSGRVLRVLRATGYSDAVAQRFGELDIDGDTPLAACVRTGEPIAIGSVHDHRGPFADSCAVAAENGHRALAALPLVDRGEPLGAIGLSFDREQPFDDDQLAFLVSIAQHGAAALERARLVEAERLARRDANSARSDAERARDHLSFLVAVGRSVSETLDHRGLLQRVLDLAVPRIADAGLALLPDEGGLRRVAIAHRDPEALQRGIQYVLGTTISVESGGPAALCFRTGEIQARRDLDHADLSTAPEYLRETVRSYGMRSWLCVPIQAGREVLGVLALAFNDPDHLDNDEDVALAIEMAGRTASGLINATLFEHERRVALALQESVLPSQLPAVSGLELAARYLPSQAEVKVGGDWYDAFTLPDGRVGVAIGDVSGHGLDAAAAMGQMRHALRAFAFEGVAPADVLGRLDRLTAHTAAREYATVLYGIVEPLSGELVWACAGHPPMIHRGANGTRAIEHPHGTIIGVDPDVPYPEGRTVLGPGEAVLLYTDGLVERRDRDIDSSIAALCEALDRPTVTTADSLCDAAVAQLDGAVARRDDVCVVAVRRSSSP